MENVKQHIQTPLQKAQRLKDELMEHERWKAINSQDDADFLLPMYNRHRFGGYIDKKAGMLKVEVFWREEEDKECQWWEGAVQWSQLCAQGMMNRNVETILRIDEHMGYVVLEKREEAEREEWEDFDEDEKTEKKVGLARGMLEGLRFLRERGLTHDLQRMSVRRVARKKGRKMVAEEVEDKECSKCGSLDVRWEENNEAEEVVVVLEVTGLSKRKDGEEEEEEAMDRVIEVLGKEGVEVTRQEIENAEEQEQRQEEEAWLRRERLQVDLMQMCEKNGGTECRCCLGVKVPVYENARWRVCGKELGSGGFGVVYPVELEMRGGKGGAAFSSEVSREMPAMAMKVMFGEDMGMETKLWASLTTVFAPASKIAPCYQVSAGLAPVVIFEKAPYTLESYGEELRKEGNEDKKLRRLREIGYDVAEGLCQLGRTLERNEDLKQVILAEEELDGARVRLVHCDMKPSNVLIWKDEEEDCAVAKVTDLGLVSVEGRLVRNVGTEGYRPPEQGHRGGRHAIGAGSDAYSWAKTMIETARASGLKTGSIGGAANDNNKNEDVDESQEDRDEQSEEDGSDEEIELLSRILKGDRRLARSLVAEEGCVSERGRLEDVLEVLQDGQPNVKSKVYLKDVMCAEAFRVSQEYLVEGDEAKVKEAWHTVKELEKGIVGNKKGEKGTSLRGGIGDEVVFRTMVRLCRDSDELHEVIEQLVKWDMCNGWVIWECWEVARARGHMRTMDVLEKSIQRKREELRGCEMQWLKLPFVRCKKAIEGRRLLFQGNSDYSKENTKMRSIAKSVFIRIFQDPLTRSIKNCVCSDRFCMNRHPGDPKDDFLFNMILLSNELSNLLSELERRLGSIKWINSAGRKIEIFSEDASSFVNRHCWKDWMNMDLVRALKVDRLSQHHACILFLLNGFVESIDNISYIQANSGAVFPFCCLLLDFLCQLNITRVIKFVNFPNLANFNNFWKQYVLGGANRLLDGQSISHPYVVCFNKILWQSSVRNRFSFPNVTSLWVSVVVVFVLFYITVWKSPTISFAHMREPEWHCMAEGFQIFMNRTLKNDRNGREKLIDECDADIKLRCATFTVNLVFMLLKKVVGKHPSKRIRLMLWKSRHQWAKMESKSIEDIDSVKCAGMRCDKHVHLWEVSEQKLDVDKYVVQSRNPFICNKLVKFHQTFGEIRTSVVFAADLQNNISDVERFFWTCFQRHYDCKTLEALSVWYGKDLRRRFFFPLQLLELCVVVFGRHDLEIFLLHHSFVTVASMILTMIYVLEQQPAPPKQKLSNIKSKPNKK